MFILKGLLCVCSGSWRGVLHVLNDVLLTGFQCSHIWLIECGFAICFFTVHRVHDWTFSKQIMIREGTILPLTKTYKLILKECPIGHLINCKIFVKKCMHFVEIKERWNNACCARRPRCENSFLVKCKCCNKWLTS